MTFLYFFASTVINRISRLKSTPRGTRLKCKISLLVSVVDNSWLMYNMWITTSNWSDFYWIKRFCLNFVSFKFILQPSKECSFAHRTQLYIVQSIICIQDLKDFIYIVHILQYFWWNMNGIKKITEFWKESRTARTIKKPIQTSGTFVYLAGSRYFFCQ